MYLFTIDHLMMISSKLMKGQGLYLASSAVSDLISPAKPLEKK